jgi:hypothetical protein
MFVLAIFFVAAACTPWECCCLGRMHLCSLYEEFCQGAQCSGFLNNVLPEGDPVLSKYVTHKHEKYRSYIYIFR